MELFLPPLEWMIPWLKYGIKISLVSFKYQSTYSLVLLFTRKLLWWICSHSIVVLFPSKSMEHLAAASPTCNDNSTKYAFEYLGHPASVVSIEWRRTSKYMPRYANLLFSGWWFDVANPSMLLTQICRGSVANMLVTSCEDSICRVWVETVLPDDGLVNMNSFDPLASQNPRFRTHRHKHKFMQRLKHMR